MVAGNVSPFQKKLHKILLWTAKRKEIIGKETKVEKEHKFEN